MPWPEWGETDFWLTQGYDAHQQLLCPHGGHYRDECSDLTTIGRWQAVVDGCLVEEERAAFLKAHPDLEPGTLLGFALLPPGQLAKDPLDDTDSDRMQAEMTAFEERMKQR